MLDNNNNEERIPDVITKIPKCDKCQLNNNNGGHGAGIYFLSTYHVLGSTTWSLDLAASLI